jgi:hypothetical protein
MIKEEEEKGQSGKIIKYLNHTSDFSFFAFLPDAEIKKWFKTGKVSECSVF